MAENALFYFKDDLTYEEKGDKKFLKPNVLALLQDLQERLKKITAFNQSNLEKTFVTFLEEREIKLGKVAQPIRVALTGKTASPGIFEVMEVLGKETVLKRLSTVITHIRNKK